ncbi:MAG: glutamyl-tRNA reductase [Planctomycetaceae bacterium]|nr:glutamyl-tRNA reductase [Planctomycetaceae bacterium]
MSLLMVGCNHRAAGVEVREQLAFNGSQVGEALDRWQQTLPETELVLISTCNRVELYAATAGGEALGPDELAAAMLDYHGVARDSVNGQLTKLADRAVIAHLFHVAASLDSMVVGEPQILAQVKEAYQAAHELGTAGPVLHELFQTALHAARRVHNETDLHRHRVSIPSVAIADFASRVFERFDDKRVLVLGAGEMAEETLRYLKDAGARNIHVVNRNEQRGRELAEAWAGAYHPWNDLWEQLIAADLVIGATAAAEPVVGAAQFAERVAPRRHQRPLFMLDLAVPRDFDPAVGEEIGVYLYSLDDLQVACERNRRERAKALPAAEKILENEVDRYLAAAHHRAAAPVITGLRRNMEAPKQAELTRLFNKLPDLDDAARTEIERFADRLVNKLLHPPMESLRDASRDGPPHGLLDALRRLFHLDD